ncbi:MAG: serpin family protein, partial [Candidatus Saccharicenans sp.]
MKTLNLLGMALGLLSLTLALFSGATCSKGEVLKNTHKSEFGWSQERRIEGKGIVSANNRFAFDLYAHLKPTDKNIFFSPFSLSSALAMTYEGARARTAEEIRKVFHFPEDKTVLRKAFLEAISEMNKEDRKYELRIANALWPQRDYQFQSEYFRTIEQYYKGTVINQDFKVDSEKSRLTINKWVEEKTAGKIKDLLAPGTVNSLTRLILTNAIYFKGNWEYQFDQRNTRQENFRVRAEKTVKVEMMSLRDKNFNYAETAELQMLELPYEGLELSMLILLPRDNLSAIEN